MPTPHVASDIGVGVTPDFAAGASLDRLAPWTDSGGLPLDPTSLHSHADSSSQVGTGATVCHADSGGYVGVGDNQCCATSNSVIDTNSGGSSASSGAYVKGSNSHADSYGSVNTADGAHSDSSGDNNANDSHADSHGSTNAAESHANSQGTTHGVASCAVAGGTTYGYRSFASGEGSNAQADRSRAHGFGSTALRDGQDSLACGGNGDPTLGSQVSRLNLSGVTAGGAGTNQSVVLVYGYNRDQAFTLQDGRCYRIAVEAVARDEGSTAFAGFSGALIVSRVGTTLTFAQNTITREAATVGATLFTLTATSDGAGGITFTFATGIGVSTPSGASCVCALRFVELV